MKRYHEIIDQKLPKEAMPVLDTLKAEYGFVPNLIKGIAVSPDLLKSYVSLSTSFKSSSLSPEEQQIVLLTVSRYNECEYCTSVHSMTAESTGLAWDTIERLRNRETLSNERLEALRSFTESVVSSGGAIAPDAWTEFVSAGFDGRNALDVVLGVTLKNLTNSVNHLIETPLDDEFQKRAWSVREKNTAHA